MCTTKLLTCALLLTGTFAVKAGDHLTQSIPQLEARLTAIDAELEQLASYSLRSGFGAIGHASHWSHSSNSTQWIQVDLAAPTPIDQIVLVPTIGRDTETGLQSNAFPQEFKIIAGTNSDKQGELIASFTKSDGHLPRIAPLVVPCSTTASWVRVEASVLSKRMFDDRFDFKLAEIMLFNGQDNAALRAPVTTSSKIKHRYQTQKPRFLTDGFVPYLMDAAQGQRHSYFLSEAITGPASISIDLGKPQALNRVHLHTVDQSFSIPLEYETDFYLPRRLRLEGALNPDFSDAVTLIELQYDSPLDLGPILMHPFPETRCRYIRLVDFEPYIDTQLEDSQRIGFAEIELFARGRNAALRKPVTANFPSRYGFELEKLTDGYNFYGEILPIRKWMNQLARRHDLEKERPVILAELNRRYAEQEQRLKWMRRIALFAVAGIGVTILVDRLIRMRLVMKLRERIAANLHDELSANLHAVALLGEVAKKNIDSRNKLEEALDRIQTLSKRSRNAARHCTNMLQADTACENLPEEMERSAQRLLMDIRHELVIEGEDALRKLSSRRRIDLFLFYKECLINIARHSSAAESSTRLTADARKITLKVTDNGTGITEVPRSLRRRAHLLGAKVSLETPRGGGTCIILSLRNRWRRRPTHRGNS